MKISKVPFLTHLGISASLIFSIHGLAKEVVETLDFLTSNEFDQREALPQAGNKPYLQLPDYPNQSHFLTEQYPALLEVVPNKRMDTYRAIYSNIYPTLISDVTQVTWNLVKGIPLVAVERDIVRRGFNEVTRFALLSVLNIQLDAPDMPINLPNTMDLQVELRSEIDPQSGKLRLYKFMFEMRDAQGDGRYFINNPIGALQALEAALLDIRNAESEIPIELRPNGTYPRPAHFRLTSLVSSETSWSEGASPVGTLLLHHVLLGDFKLTTGWQWLGRLPNMPGTQQPGFISVIDRKGERQK